MEAEAFVSDLLTEAPKDLRLYQALQNKQRACLLPLQLRGGPSVLVVLSEPQTKSPNVRMQLCWIYLGRETSNQKIQAVRRLLCDINYEMMLRNPGKLPDQLLSLDPEVLGLDLANEPGMTEQDAIQEVIDRLRPHAMLTRETMLPALGTVAGQSQSELEEVLSEPEAVASGFTRWALFRQMVRRCSRTMWVQPPPQLALEPPFVPRFMLVYDWNGRASITVVERHGETRVEFFPGMPGTPMHDGDVYALRFVELLREEQDTARASEALQSDPPSDEWRRTTSMNTHTGLRHSLLQALRLGPAWRSPGTALSDDVVVRGAQQRLARTLQQNPHLSDDEAGLAAKLRAQWVYETKLRQLAPRAGDQAVVG